MRLHVAELYKTMFWRAKRVGDNLAAVEVLGHWIQAASALPEAAVETRAYESGIISAGKIRNNRIAKHYFDMGMDMAQGNHDHQRKLFTSLMSIHAREKNVDEVEKLFRVCHCI